MIRGERTNVFGLSVIRSKIAEKDHLLDAKPKFIERDPYLGSVRRTSPAVSSAPISRLFHPMGCRMPLDVNGVILPAVPIAVMAYLAVILARKAFIMMAKAVKAALASCAAARKSILQIPLPSGRSFLFQGLAYD